MKTLILGAGNLLLSDEGFGVHFVRYLEQHYLFPKDVELFDAGTMGLLAAPQIEEFERVYIVDALAISGEPGACFRFAKEDIMLRRLPVKLSPHQAGVAEMLLVSELRGRCPAEVMLLGVIPATFEPGDELSPRVHRRLSLLAADLVAELQTAGLPIAPRKK